MVKEIRTSEYTGRRKNRIHVFRTPLYDICILDEYNKDIYVFSILDVTDDEV